MDPFYSKADYENFVRDREESRERIKAAIAGGVQAACEGMARSFFDNRPKVFAELLKERARELAEDFPFTDTDDAFQLLWAITSTLEGTDLANKDLHEIITRLEAENATLRKSILRFGNNPAGFDWAVLGRIEKLEATLTEVRECMNLLGAKSIVEMIDAALSPEAQQ